MRAKIRIIKGGPYEVSGGVPLREVALEPANKEAPEAIIEKRILHPGKGTYLLCRCGHSYSKPFCDGAHEAINFEGIEVASRKPYLESVQAYSGVEYDLLDQRSLCVHTRLCTQFEGVWDMINSNDPDKVRKAKEIIALCPSGRLTVRKKDGTVLEPHPETEICMLDDPHNNCMGALHIRGGIELESADGSTYEVRNRMALCRCGKSKNIPFCDATHVKVEDMKLD